MSLFQVRLELRHCYPKRGEPAPLETSSVGSGSIESFCAVIEKPHPANLDVPYGGGSSGSRTALGRDDLGYFHRLLGPKHEIIADLEPWGYSIPGVGSVLFRASDE